MKRLEVSHVVAEFKRRFGELKAEQQKSFRWRVLVHDYEIFTDDILLQVLEPATGKHQAIWGIDAIKDFLRRHFVRNESAILVGFNNKSFDNKITDAILAGFGQDGIKRLSDELIAGDRDVPWKSSDSGKGKPEWVGRTFDIGFDIGQRKIGNPPNERKIPEIGLKKWERLNGWEVCRCGVPFDKRNLTRGDRAEVEYYCLYDCCGTAMVLLSDEAWDGCFNARRVLVDDYGHLGVDWEMTKPRITAIVLNAKEENFAVPETWENEFFILPKEVRIWKHRDVLRAYTTNTFGALRGMSSKRGNGKGVLSKLVCGVPHLYGVGGVHGCNKGIWTFEGNNIWSLDVASMYPEMMRQYNFLSRRVIGEDRKRFGEMIDLRTKVYKPAGDKRADGLKLVLNGGFGSMGFDKSEMYDPVNFCSVTILGQLFITDLLEKCERHIELIQSNTDGIFFRLKDTSAESLAGLKAIVAAFEARTRLTMEWTEFERMYQRDISNYVAREVPKPGKPAGSGKVKSKGTYFKIKHCSVTPYLYAARVHAALNNGAVLSPDGFEIDRFAIALKRDKNSEAFMVNGARDDREWVDVVPVPPNSPVAQRVEVVCKEQDAAVEDDSLFALAGVEQRFTKRRKATGCPQCCALVENVTLADIDLAYYRKEGVKVDLDAEDEDEDGILFD